MLIKVDVATSAIWVSGFAMISALATPWLQNWGRRQEKLDEYRRQDEVAKRAEDVSNSLQASQNKLTKQNDDAAKLLLATNNKVDEHARVQEAKLEQIHTLVNSNLTAEMQDRLAALKLVLVSLEEILTLKQTAAPDAHPAEETVATVAATKIKIAELSKQIEDRIVQTKQASVQLANDLKG